MATRNSGRCESSLKTSGDEICAALVRELHCIWFRDRDRECQTYLVGSIADADVKVGDFCLYEISYYDP